MDRDDRQASKDIECRRIDRTIAALKNAGSRCRKKDVRYGLGVTEALSFLALHATEQWPFEQFQNALADSGMDGLKPKARWQVRNASERNQAGHSSMKLKGRTNASSTSLVPKHPHPTNCQTIGIASGKVTQAKPNGPR